MPKTQFSRSWRRKLSSLATRLSRTLESRPKKLRAAIEPLENRAMLSAVSWDAGGDGVNWHDALNWSNDQLPTADDDVTINLPEADPSISITIDAGDILINSLTSDESLTLTAGSLSVATTLDISTHNLTLAGGSLKNATVNASSGASVIVTGTSSAIDSVTLNTNLDLTSPGSALTSTTGVTLNGTATLGTNSRLRIAGTQTIAGSGSIVLNGSTSSVMSASDDMTLTIGPGITITTGASATGTTYVGYAPWTPGANTALINNGTIASGISGATLNVGGNSGTFTNNASLSASSSGTLTLSGNWANKGTITANAGTLNLAGTTSQVGTLALTNAQVNISGAIDNTDGNLTLDTSTNTWTLTGSIARGTVTASGSSGLKVSGLLAALDAVTFEGNLNLASSARLTITNGLTLNGAATLASSSKLLFSGTQTLSGTGSVTFTGSSAGLLASANDMALTIGSGITIATDATATFTNYIGYASSFAGTNTSVINNGTITSGVSGATLALSAKTGTFTNNGTVSAAASGILDLSGTWANPGTIAADTASINVTGAVAHSGVFSFSKSSLTITGSLDLTGSATSIDTSANAWTLSTGTLIGAKLTGSTGLNITGNSSTLDAVTVDGNLTLGANVRTTIKNGLTINGTATLGSSARLMFSGTQTLAGTGSVLLNGASAGVITSGSDMTLTIGSGITINTGAAATGTVNIGHVATFGGANTSLINNGTLSASVSSATLSIGANSGTFTNNNAISGTTSSNISLTGNWSNLGTISANSSTLTFEGYTTNVGTLSLTNAAINITGTLDYTGSQFTFDTESVVWTLASGTLKGGTFNITGAPGLIAPNSSTSTFDGITLHGNLTVNAATINVKNGLTFTDSIYLNTLGSLKFLGTQELSGTGSIYFNANGAYVVTAANDMTLTIGSGVTISTTAANTNTNYVGHTSSWGGTNTSLVNNGTIITGKNTLIVSANGGTFTNNGSLKAMTAGTLTMAGNWTNAGTITVDNATLNLGGNFTSANTITRNAGNINLTGTLNNTGSTLALNASTGSWNLSAGTIIGGNITTADGAQLEVPYFSTGTLDSVTMDGTLALSGLAHLTIKNGLVLNGTANLSNSSRLLFSGTQTLDGTGKVIFTSYGGELSPTITNTTLTIGAGITVITSPTAYSINSIGDGYSTASKTNIVNYGSLIADGSGTGFDLGSNTGSVINYGTITAKNKGSIEINQLTLNAGTIAAESSASVDLNTSYATTWSNTGTLSALSSGTLETGSTWTNTGTLTADAGTLNLDGSWTTSGTHNTSKGTVNITGTLNNTGATLDLNASTGSWILASGSILGGTINTSAGYGLKANSSSSNYIDGVIINGFLDLQTTFSWLKVKNGLVLNGTASITNSSGLLFEGTQALTGSAAIKLDTHYGIIASSDDMTLTLGPDIFISRTGTFGTSYIGYHSFYGGKNTSLINYATINSSTASTIISIGANSGTFTNYGALAVSSSGTLSLTGNWTNKGTFTVNAGTLNLAGSFSGNDLSGVTRSGGTINLSGTVSNTGSVLALNASTGSYNLAGATIQGGTITTADAAELVVSSSSANTLDGVTFNGNLNLKTSSARTILKNGFTLNGTATLGTFAQLLFAGTQTFAGTGTVTFTSTFADILANSDDMTLTIGSGITINTGSGAYSMNYVGYASPTGGANSSLINNGTITSGVSGATIAIDTNAGSFTNHGVVKAENSGLVSISDLAASDGSISALSSGTLTLVGPWTSAGVITVNSATLNLAGTFKNGDFTIARTAGTVNITGTLDNTASTLALTNSTGSMNLAGGTILGGNITTSGSAVLALATNTTSTLDGVTLDGTLQATASSAHATIKNGLTLNGSAYLGSSNRLLFSGSQSLAGSGTIYFQGASSGVLADTPGMTLTIESGITIKTTTGATGTNTIGYLASYSGTGISVINHGAILSSVSGATIALAAEGVGVFANDGQLKALSAGTLSLNSTWTNTGAITVDSSTLNLAGNFKSLGNITRNAGTINITGKLDNTGSNLLIDPTIGTLTLAGGTIIGGTITTSGGARLQANTSTANTLDGVTFIGDLDVMGSSSQLTIKNGISLTGTINLGFTAALNFSGTQSITGVGSINFMSFGASVAPAQPEMTLTIDSGITIQTVPSTSSGSPNYIGYANSSGSKTTVINNGSVIANNGWVYLAYNSGSFVNNGLLKAANTAAMSAYGLTNSGEIQVAPGASFSTNSNLLSNITLPANFNVTGAITFVGPSTSIAPQLLEAMGSDLGPTSAGYTDNFDLASVSVSSGAYLKLVDLSDNSPGSDPEAVYLNKLTVTSGGTLDLNGLHVYTKGANLAGSVINGTVTVIPYVAAIELDKATSSSLSTAGEIDDWTFTGKAGQTISVVVTNSTRIQAQLIDESGTVLSTLSNSTSGSTVTLPNVTLLSDGTYKVRITAPPGQTTSGSYNITVWNVLPPAVIEPTPIVVNEGTYTLSTIDIYTLFEDNQTPDSSLTYSIHNYAVGLSSSPSLSGKNLYIYLDPDFFGSTWVQVKATDASGLSSIVQIPITVTAINDAPWVTASTPPTSLEDAGPQTLTNWATFNPGSPYESGQTIDSYTVTKISDPSLFSVLPSVDANGTLSYTAAPNAYGTSSFYVSVKDNAGTSNGGSDTSYPKSYSITIDPVNDKPSFKASDPVATNEDAHVWGISNWATASYGAPNEPSIYRSYSITNVSNPSLFSTLPAVDSSGYLTYAPATNQFGVSTFTVKFNDGEGTANGGINWSDEQTFTITVNSVNDVPSATWFSKSVTVTDANAGAPITLPNWAIFNPGAENETDQTATYTVTQSPTSPNAFAKLPQIDSSGNLTFTPTLNYHGLAYFIVQVKDSGGTANFGRNTSTFRTASINITDRITPTVTGIQSLPTHILPSLGSINITFSEAINTSSFSWSSLSLTRDGGSNLIDATTGAGLTLTLVSDTTYAISGLSALTSQGGQYSLTLLDQGVYDSHSSLNKLSGSASTSFTIGTAPASAPVLTDESEGKPGSGYTNTTTPTVTGTATPGATVTIFEGAIDRGSATADASGVYSIVLSALSAGAHTIKAVASSPYNTAADSPDTIITVDTSIPTLVNISSYPTPRATPVLAIALRISSALDLTTLTWQDLTLTRNGSENLITSASGVTITPSGTDPNIYTINLPASLVNTIGVYTLTVAGADVQNLAGSSYTNSKSTTWTIIPGTPSAPILDASSESKAGSGITQFATPTVKGTGSVGSTIEIFEDTTLLGTGIVGADGKYSITLSTLTAGAHTLKARASDAGANITAFSATSTITVETATPTILSMSVYSVPRTVSVGSTGIRFSSQIDLSTFTAADLVFTRDGAAISTAGITITVSPTDNKLYTIVIPPSLNAAPGVYVLQVLGAGIKNVAGKQVGNNFSNTWTILPQILNMSSYAAPRTVPLTATGIRFNGPVSLPTFTWQDLTLTRNNGANLATSAITITVSPTDPNLYTILLPASLTNTPGTYILTVTGAGIQDVKGYTIANNFSTTWTQI